MPPVTEKMKLPAERYDHLEKENPQLHQIIDKVATDVGVPAVDLANIAYASSEFKPGTPGGYMNVSPQTAQHAGHSTRRPGLQRLSRGAEVQNLSDQYGVSTRAPGAHADQDTIERWRAVAGGSAQALPQV
jgi:hypothetical protein